MQIVPMYKYTRDDGGIDVSPTPPDNREYTILYRIVADKGKVITRDGVTLYGSCDTEDVQDWYELDAPEDDIDE